MKKTFFKLVLLLLFSQSLMKAQYVGGGGTAPTERKNTVDKNDPWRTRFYLNFCAALPVGTWRQYPDPDGSVYDAYTNRGGMGAKVGFAFDMGSMFYLKKIALPENMGVAINATYLGVQINGFTWKSVGGKFATDATSYFPFFFYYAKLGGQYSFNPLKNMYLDAYFNLVPTYMAIGNVYTGSSDDNPYGYGLDVTGDGGGFGLRKNVGVNFRYSVLTLGLDLVFGGINKTVAVREYLYSGPNSTKTLVYSESIETKFRATSLQFKFGFTF